MRRALKTAALCVFLSSAALADVIYVDLNATGSNDGTSWANAFTDLQDALAASASADEIWVAAGTYLPTDTADRTLSFAMKNGVGIYGGFDGTEATRAERDPAANVTILSGDIGVPASTADNSYHVVTTDGTVTLSSVLDGFSITAGQANGAEPDVRGGGMWMNGGSPTLANLKFVSNFASSAGGGLRVSSGSAAMTNCSFLSNSVGVRGHRRRSLPGRRRRSLLHELLSSGPTACPAPRSDPEASAAAAACRSSTPSSPRTPPAACTSPTTTTRWRTARSPTTPRTASGSSAATPTR